MLEILSLVADQQFDYACPKPRRGVQLGRSMMMQLLLPFFLRGQIHLSRVSLSHYGGKKARGLHRFLTRQIFYLKL
jgi:hypothetical protein